MNRIQIKLYRYLIVFFEFSRFSVINELTVVPKSDVPKFK